MVIAKIEGKCQFEDCDRPAEVIASGRIHGLGCYCEPHATVVLDEENPEYTAGCPNCGCQFGVN